MRTTLLGILVLALASGCAEERPPVDRVQPNALRKSALEGEWYYQKTVVDVPASNGFTFVGNTDHAGLQKVVWDIQERFLYARRTVELIKGADDKIATKNDYAGEVVAAFEVESHFDIVNAYNPTTGEQLNILEENETDRPWYEREYMRIDWSENLVHNYQLDFETASVESVPYFVQETNPETGERNPDAPWFEEDGSYFDVTTRLFAKSGTVELPGYGTIPLCWLRGEELTECGAGEYSIRHSFLLVDPKRQYDPMPYKGKQTELFGFFTSDRMTYSSKEGITEQGRERYLNRHNIWKTWFDSKGEPIPYAKREVRPIVYHVNTDFPDDLKKVALEVGDQWNAVFVDVVKALGHEPKGRVFVLCPNNPVREGDPAECGAAGLSPRLGDIRYSFMAYVAKYMTYGLLGLGPSNNDPETGEIISGMAYVYHHNNNAAYRVQEMLELLNGTLPPDEFINGVNLTSWMSVVSGESEKPSRQHGLEDARHMVERVANGWQYKYFADTRHAPTQADLDFQKEHGFAAWAAPALDRMYQHGLANGEMHAPDGMLAKLRDTYIEDLLLNDEMLVAAGVEPGTQATAEQIQATSVARGGFGKASKVRAELRERFAEQRNMYLPEMADDALVGLAKELKGMDPAKAFDVVRTTIYRAVLAHETGHSLGLMHNFGGSDDAINYHDDYWKIRDDGKVGPRLEDPITQAEQDARIYDSAYSSIMDYAGRYTIDGKGVGKYDRAAMLYGYAGKIEVFEDGAGVPFEDFKDWYEWDGDPLRFTPQGPRAIHYTSYYEKMGEKLYSAKNRKLVDVSDLSEDYSKAEVDGKEYARVPYIYCSHSRSDLGDNCLTRDFGADSYERMKNILDDLDTWYITRSFPRGQIGSSTLGYVTRYYGRVYNRLKKWHDLYGLYHGLFAQYYEPQQMESFLTDPRSGWGAKTWAVQNAFNYLVQTVLMPDIGPYGGPWNPGDDNYMLAPYMGQPLIELDVTNARFFSTSWQNPAQECGYFWWECLHHIGSYVDKIMAIEALTDSETNFVARATPKDLREWEVSYYSTFAEQIGKINAAILGGDWSRVGPYYDASDGQLHWPNYAGGLYEPHSDIGFAGKVNKAPVDPAATFTVQLFWQVLGMARFWSNFDQSFRDESRVFVVGTSFAPEVPDEDLALFTDPTSGITYGALRYGNVEEGGGQALLARANAFTRRSNFCDTGKGLTTAQKDDDCDATWQQKEYDDLRAIIDARLLDHIEKVKVLADLAPALTHGNPYSL